MHKIQTRLLIFISDVIALTLAVIISGIICRYISHAVFDKPYYDLLSGIALSRFINFGVMSSIIIFLFYNQGHYTKRVPWWDQVGYIISAICFSLILETFIHFAVKNQISRLWIVASWCLAFLFIISGRQIVKFICDHFEIWQIKTIIIGGKNNIIETSFALCSESYAGYQLTNLIMVDGYSDFNNNDLPVAYKNIKIIDGSKDYNDIIKENRDSFYIIAPDSFDNLNVENLIHKIMSKDSNYAVVPPMEGIRMYGSKPQYFFGYDVIFLPALERINSPLSKLIKRTIDIIGSIMGLLILSPLLLMVCFFVKRDGGPAFFSQDRIGKDGKTFKCWKFRSMRIDAEEVLSELLKNDPEKNKSWKTHRKIDDDPRITKVGRYLRNSSIDEFPQLFNVLKGDMSLVGPRPIVGEEAMVHNQKELKNYASIRPGITGLWQVSGRSDISIKQRIYFNNWYIKNWSIWHDIVIIIKTIFVVIKRAGAR